jgi:hypothetical protein
MKRTQPKLAPTRISGETRNTRRKLLIVLATLSVLSGVMLATAATCWIVQAPTRITIGSVRAMTGDETIALFNAHILFGVAMLFLVTSLLVVVVLLRPADFVFSARPVDAVARLRSLAHEVCGHRGARCAVVAAFVVSTVFAVISVRDLIAMGTSDYQLGCVFGAVLALVATAPWIAVCAIAGWRVLDSKAAAVATCTRTDPSG